MQFCSADPSCVNAKDELGRSAVMYAVHFGSDDCLEMLLSRGASVNDCSEGQYELELDDLNFLTVETSACSYDSHD